MNAESPLVTLCLFTYNQERYVKDAILGALSQTYSPLEIIISDDCSQDSTYEIVIDTIRQYEGPHTIVNNRNEKNLGLGAHFSKVCYKLAKGEYLLMAAGDDISKNEHVEQAVNWINKLPDATMIDFVADIIDSEGQIVKEMTLERQIKKNTLDEFLMLKPISSFGAGRIVKRSLLSLFEPISIKCPTEDSILILRSLLVGVSYRVSSSLLYYRRHETNLSGAKSLSRLSNEAIIAQYLADIIHAYNHDIIDDPLFTKLINRINLELEIRRFNYGVSKSKIESIAQRCKIWLAKYFYKKKISKA